MRYLFFVFLCFLEMGCKKEEIQVPATVLTLAASDITMNSALLRGQVEQEGSSTVSERGFVWSFNRSPTFNNGNKIVAGNGKGSFEITVKNLIPASTYYFVSYAMNSSGTSFGPIEKFTTAEYKLPTISTEVPKNITYTTVQLGGTIINDGGLSVIERGLVLSPNPSPTTLDIKITNDKGLGNFSTLVTGLKENTKYFSRAYAVNGKGTAYGNEVEFKTDAFKLPTVTSDRAVNIGPTFVTIFGTVSGDGGAKIKERGFCISKSPNPNFSNIRVMSSTSDLGAYSLLITNLSYATNYYVKSYAINNIGISWGAEFSFKTAPRSVPFVYTSELNKITQTSCLTGLTIFSDGGQPISQKGLLISEKKIPAYFDRTIRTEFLGSGNEEIITTVERLKPGTTYYVRGFAINDLGYGYGQELSFTTLPFEFKTVTSKTGKIWMDRNLGANQVATSPTDIKSFGDLYQYGRGVDGHQLRNSITTELKSNSDDPGHNKFIIVRNFSLTRQENPGSLDWRSPSNWNLWENELNNPCPDGFRRPSLEELTAELAIFNSKDAKGAFDSILKLPLSGSRRGPTPFSEGDAGFYWAGPWKVLVISSNNASFQDTYSIVGNTLRCVKK